MPAMFLCVCVHVRLGRGPVLAVCALIAPHECLRASRKLLAGPGCKRDGEGVNLGKGVLASVSHMPTRWKNRLRLYFHVKCLISTPPWFVCLLLFCPRLCRNCTGENCSPHLSLQQVNRMTRSALTQSSPLKRLKVNLHPRTPAFWSNAFSL